MDRATLMRQSDLIPMDRLDKRITIIGAGGIGSHTAIALAKMGFTNMVVWDFDDVSAENMNAQGYMFKHIGRPKVECLRELVKDYANEDIEIRNEKFEAQQLTGIVISAVDSMAVRRLIWNKVKGSALVEKLIDPRMSIEYAVMYVMDPNDKKDQTTYEKTLYTDAEAVAEPCTMKAVMYTTSMIAGLVGKAVKSIATDKPYTRNLVFNIEDDFFQCWRKGTHAVTDLQTPQHAATTGHQEEVAVH